MSVIHGTTTTIVMQWALCVDRVFRHHMAPDTCGGGRCCACRALALDGSELHDRNIKVLPAQPPKKGAGKK